MQGGGRMTLGNNRVELNPGDTVAIPAGTWHSVLNHGKNPLVLLCACTPAYAHEDTELAEGQSRG